MERDGRGVGESGRTAYTRQGRGFGTGRCASGGRGGDSARRGRCEQPDHHHQQHRHQRRAVRASSPHAQYPGAYNCSALHWVPSCAMAGTPSRVMVTLAPAVGAIGRPRGAVRAPRLVGRRVARFRLGLGTVTCANDRTKHSDAKSHAVDNTTSGRLPDQRVQAGPVGLTLLSAELRTALDALVLTFAGESITLTLAQAREAHQYSFVGARLSGG